MPNIEWRKVKKKDLEKDSLGTHDYEASTDTHIIEIPPHASTRTKLHELYHAYQQPMEDPYTGLDRLRREVEAEVSSYDNMGKVLSFRIGLTPMFGLIRDEGFSVTSTFDALMSLYEEYGIDLTAEEKAYIWDCARKAEKKP